jgi:hypothetical protein
MLRSMTRWTLAGCAALAAFAAVALSAGVAQAGKPGGGGAVPPGRIFFQSSGGLWSMNADGSGKTALPAAVRGVPSNRVHGGARWFLFMNTPDGFLHAIREDGSSDVQLTAESPLYAYSEFVWGGDDSFVSFSWKDSGVPSTTRISRVEIGFDASGVPSAAGGPAAIPGIAEYSLGAHSWSPGGDRVAWIDFANLEYRLNVTTVASGARALIAVTSSYADSAFSDSRVAWSPDGARILFDSGQGIDTIDPSGANRRNILAMSGGRNKKVAVVAADWSPDSASIVYGRNVFELFVDRDRRAPSSWYELVAADVYRASADGSAPQNLTAETNFSSIAFPIAWR